MNFDALKFIAPILKSFVQIKFSVAKKRERQRRSLNLFHFQSLCDCYFFKKSGISMFVKLGETSGIEVLLTVCCG